MAWSDAARAAAAEARRRKGRTSTGASRTQRAKVLRYVRSTDKNLPKTGLSMANRNAHVRAAAEARRNMHGSLRNLGGVASKTHPMVATLRATAAKTIRANRTTMKKMGFKMPAQVHYLAAHAAVNLKTAQIARMVAKIKAK